MDDGRISRACAGIQRHHCYIALVLCVLSLAPLGCVAPLPLPDRFAVCDPSVPREQNRYSLAPYHVMPPDILQVEAVYNVRGAITRLRSGDQLTVRLLNGIPLDLGEDQPQNVLQLYTKAPEIQAKIINGPYVVLADGTIDLGAAYGKISVAGLTIDESKTAIVKYLHDQAGLREPKVSVQLADMAGRQAITGQHLVRPDGTIGLGIYGELRVSGMTLDQIRQALEVHLSQFLNQPMVSVDVLAYNSKVYYVIMDGGGYGQQIVRLPCTGNETVLDAIAQVSGLPQVSSKRIWIARPSPEIMGHPQILKVNWQSITSDAVATTNYQIMPYDRIYVQADNLIATDNFLAKLIAPVNRVLGVTLLGSSTYQEIQSIGRGGTGGTGGVGQ
jgi:polysaccharide biosynthesis/export protein